MGAYAPTSSGDDPPMNGDSRAKPEICNCLALRQAARHVTQFYDRVLAPAGLRPTPFSILGKLKQMGPMTINPLPRDLLMDRTTPRRNILPLHPEALIPLSQSPSPPPHDLTPV